MKGHKRKKSDKLQAILRSALWHERKAIDRLYCWRLEKETGLKYTDEQRNKLSLAAKHIDSAEKLVREVYAELIGNQVVQEVSETAW